jgi:superoxide dismutase, Cu-Zn family
MKFLTLPAFLFSLLILASCADHEVTDRHMDIDMPTWDILVAVVHPTEGNEAAGTVTFTQTDTGVRVQANISGLDSGGTHGFHIHEYGDCRAPDAMSAGGHFNPTDMPHGGPMDDERHMGDMGNLEADENGVAVLDYIDEKIELGGPNSILGFGVVVHERRDDLESQPVGDAGGRISCGVIGVANPEQ